MSEKISDEDLLAETQRAIRLCADDDEREQFTMTHREARLLDAAVDRGAAALAAQKELVDALEFALKDGDCDLQGADYDSEWEKVIDLLVRFGRVRKDGDSYKWVTP